MKFKKIALAGVISLAAVVAAAGIAGAANGGNALHKTPRLKAAQIEHQTACNDKAKCSERGIEFKGFAFLNSAANLLGLQPQELKAELKTGKSLKDIASAKGIDSAKFAQDLEAALAAEIDQAVQNGKIDSEKANALKTDLSQRVQTMLERKWDDRKGREFRGGAKGYGKEIFNQAQTLLGIDAATLKTELHSGKSLADIAQSKGISKDTLTAKIQAAITTNLDQAVADQKITADKAAKIKENLAQKIEKIVTRQHIPKQPEVKADQTEAN